MAHLRREDILKYLPLENVLAEISKDFISFSPEVRRTYTDILEQILNCMTNRMKNVDNLFKKMYTEVFYGGSIYDGLRVGTPNEFDLDLLLTLPVESEFILSNIPGYLHLKLKRINEDLKRLVEDEKDYYLDNQKVRQWMESVIKRAFNDFEKENGICFLNLPHGTFLVKVHKAGPAFTLKVTGKIKGEEINFKINLVPSFQFDKDQWPKPPFRDNPIAFKTDFFIVPKPLNDDVPGRSNRYWRLSFQRQEREIIKQKQFLKPTIRFLKKLRDVSDHKIASYYIKTVVLWETDRMSNEFWHSSLSYVFMTILKRYYACLMDKNIPYYWYRKNYLIHDMKDSTMLNIQRRIKNIITDIENNLQDDPTIITKYLLTEDERERYRSSHSLNVATTTEFSTEQMVAMSVGIGALAIGAVSLWKAFSNSDNRRN